MSIGRLVSRAAIVGILLFGAASALAQNSGRLSNPVATIQTNAAGKLPAASATVLPWRVVSHYTINEGLGFAPTQGEGANVVTTLGVGVAPAIVGNGSGSCSTSSSGQVFTGTTGMGTKFTATGTVAAGSLASIQSFTPGAYVIPPTSLTVEPVTGDGCTGVTLNLVDASNGLALNSPTLGWYGITGTPTVAAGGSSCNGASNQNFQDATAISNGVNSPAKFKLTISGGAVTAFSSLVYAGRYAPGAFPANLAVLPVYGRNCVAATLNVTFGIVTPTGAGGQDYAATTTLSVTNGSGDSTGNGGCGSCTVTVTSGAVASFGSWTGGAGYTKLPTLAILGPKQLGSYLTTDQGELDATPDTSPKTGFSNPKIKLCNWGIGTANAVQTGFLEIVPQNANQFAAWIEYPLGSSPSLGTIAPFPFKNGASVYQQQGQNASFITIQPGACVWSDTIGFSIPANTAYRVWTSVIAGGPPYQWPLGGISSTRTGYGYLTAAVPSAIAYPSELALNSGYTNAHFAPTMLVAQTATPAVLIVGDSVFDGFKDNAATDFSGSVARALGYSYGWLKVTRPSDKVANWYATPPTGQYPGYNVSQSALRRAVDLEFFSMATTELGSNDLNVVTGSYAAVLTNLQSLWSWLENSGVPTYPATMPPRSTSTDGFATVANQTAQTGWGPGAYNSYNATIRACPTAGYCHGFLEYGDLLASSHDSGLFIASAASPPNPLIYTWEGTHQLEAAASTYTGLNATPTVNAAGTLGTPGPCVVTLSGGTSANSSAAQLNVTINGGGGIGSVNSVENTGAYTANPSATPTVTGCSLSGASVAATYGNNPASIGYSWAATGAGPFAANSALTNLQTQLTAILATF